MKEKLKRGKEAKISKKSHIALHTSHNSGITLVALIITIIVLLILAVVAIRAVQGDGIIQHAKNAADSYSKAVKNEQSELDSYLAKLNENGKNGGEVDTDLKAYLIGDTPGSKNIMSLIDESRKFKADESMPEFTGYSNIKWAYMGDEEDGEIENTTWFHIRYGRDTYRLLVNGETGNSYDLQLFNKATGNLGKYVTYNGMDYIVVSENGDTVDLITANTLGSVTLGDNDSFTNSLDDYNNVIDKLVEACKTETGLTVGGEVISIRSVGGPATDTTTGTFTSANMRSIEGYDASNNDWFATYWDSYTFKAEDENYASDYKKLETLGLRMTDNFGEYWLASQIIDAGSYNVNFSIRSISGMGSLFGSLLCTVDDDGNSACDSYECGVRAVVTLSSSAIADQLS